jgi:XTP/dITP diphosphohydrolase
MNSTQTKTLLMATTNDGKRNEIQSFFNTLSVPINVTLPQHLEDVEETGTTFLANAQLKAEAALSNPTDSDWVMAEDSGFSIPALDGIYHHSPFPGIHSNRWMTPDIRHDLLGIDGDVHPIVQTHLSAGIYALIERHQLAHPIAARYHCAMVVLDKHSGDIVFQTEETAELTIVPKDTPAGPHGFGYDSITCPTPESLVGFNVPPHQTTSHIATEYKNQFSHRAKALQAFVDSLDF